MPENEDRLDCNLTAIPEEERDRHKKFSGTVLGAIVDFKELTDGYGFKLPQETRVIEQAGSFLARERLCCPFFHFELDVNATEEEVWLKLSGGDQVKRFIEGTLLKRIQQSSE